MNMLETGLLIIHLLVAVAICGFCPAATRQGRRHGCGIRQRFIGKPLWRRRFCKLSFADHGDPRGDLLRFESWAHMVRDDTNRAIGRDPKGRDGKDGAEGVRCTIGTGRRPGAAGNAAPGAGGAAPATDVPKSPPAGDGAKSTEVPK
jgi:hypothetical protein